MDKASTAAREHIASLADLVGAVRLPEASMRATAGTDVVIDVLVFQRRTEEQTPGGHPWMILVQIPHTAEPDQVEWEAVAEADAATTGGNAPDKTGAIAINEYFASHPEMVLGVHAQKRGIYGPGLTYTCRALPDAGPLEDRLTQALHRLPSGICTPSLESTPVDEPEDAPVRPGTAAEGATIKEDSYLIGKAGVLTQIVGGVPEPIAIREGKGTDGIPAKSAKIIRALLPIRDAVRDVFRAQAANRPWAQAQVKLRVAYSAFIRYFGPINHTVVAVTTDAETGEERETHRRPNLAPFADDPDCWLLASIESYDLETGLARKGPIFSERVIAPPAAPLITSAADALAVTLAETGRVDLDHLADLIERDQATVLAQLGTAIFRNPRTESWETADAYLSGAVRTKLAAAESAAALDLGKSSSNLLKLKREIIEQIPRLCSSVDNSPPCGRSGTRLWRISIIKGLRPRRHPPVISPCWH